MSRQNPMFWNKGEIARACGITYARVGAMIKSGELPAPLSIGGGLPRWPRGVIEPVLLELGVPAEHLGAQIDD